MRSAWWACFFFVFFAIILQDRICFGWDSVGDWLQALPEAKSESTETSVDDFLLAGDDMFRARAFRTSDGTSFVLDNGLIRRTWRLAADNRVAACVAFDNLMTGHSMLRSVRPELTLRIEGRNYQIGGFSGQKNHAYLTLEWIDEMARLAGEREQSVQLVDVELSRIKPSIEWLPRRHFAKSSTTWPPKGLELEMTYRLDVEDAKGETTSPQHVFVSVHYELYSGLPLICKWATVRNQTNAAITVDSFELEQLAVVEHSNWVEAREGVSLPKPDYLHVETDFAFGGFNHENANRHVVHWRADPSYATQVNYLKQTPCLLVVRPTYGPAQTIEPDDELKTFRAYELVYDSSERERRGMTLKRMYRTISPWVTENPITHHLINSDPNVVRRAIDQAKDVGFEAVIMSFGSGFDMESTDEEYLDQWKKVADYAEQRGVELGAYSLFSSRNVGDEHQIVCPEGQKPTHGQCPAATSTWGLGYYKKLREFYDLTGFDQFENDGPYPGDVDVTPRPPYQKGEQDSRWAQWRIVTRLYKHLRANGVYINAPDYYYLSGSNKCGMGYREVNWSLPREQQVIHTRQNIYDGTWTKTPSMGWMFVPLSQYHGGGAAATIEPLNEHLDHYDRLLKSNLGMGVQAHYRGPRLYDTKETRDLVKSNVAWFKKYRNILESDFVHGRRADGKELDWVLHVNPRLETQGMLCIYNPT